jgi:hypothetical protein
MSDHENEPADADEVRELSDDELDEVAGGNVVGSEQHPGLQQ